MSRPLRLIPQFAQSIEFSCPLCGSDHAAYIFGTDRFRIFRCAGCALTFSRPPARATALGAPQPSSSRTFTRDVRQQSGFLAAFDAASIEGAILVLADDQDNLVNAVKRRGMKIEHLVGRDDLETREWDGPFAAAIVTDELMRVANPLDVLSEIHRRLRPGASLLLSVPLLDAQQARIMGRNWHEWQASNRWYFTRETLHLLLLSAGFECVQFKQERRTYSLNNLSDRLHVVSDLAIWMHGVKALRRIAPGKLRDREFPLPSGTAVVTATAVQKRQDCIVSIIVPVFNERATLQTMMDTLLAKPLEGARKEIIVVESNSTDGSRELVQGYAHHPDVKILLQQAPRGKGYAVREGIAAATGDILMIQDADLEYDIDDYDGLLAPLMSWQSMFVLGSRHQGGWKMRKFNDTPLTAAIFNLGHGFFRSIINTLLNTRMTDPFTMYKLFRRDAIYNLELVCNRFDFDIELVMKLIRKGYIPLELPVNYAARSFAEGKKVSFTRDGMAWLWTILKLRFCSLEPERR